MTRHDSTASLRDSQPCCSSITAKGRRCRYRVSRPGSSLCALHSRPRSRRQPGPEANPLAGLPPELATLSSYADIIRFLARVLTLLSENCITPRRAAVLSYIANSLLDSLRAGERLAQYESAQQPEEELQIDWSSVPQVHRPHYTGPDVANASSSSPAAPSHPESPSHADPRTTHPRFPGPTAIEPPPNLPPNTSTLIASDEKSCRSFSYLAQAPALGDTRPPAPSGNEDDAYYDQPHYDSGVPSSRSRSR
jgi:hypothetical protein